MDRCDLIYHETQQAALCGVHAVNTLLQAPHFSEVEMAQIAAELDAAEHALMAHGGLESAEYLQFVAEGSGNVDVSGMFSIQVLAKSLEVFGLQAVPLSSPDASAARADPTTQQAFICNLQEHWFTIRKIHDQWWNLNSVYSAPEPLSEFYLAAYLDSLRDQGYTIFVIVGALPQSQPPASEEERFVPGVSGRWFTPEEARAATQEREALKKEGYHQAVAQGVMGKAAEGQGNWVTLSRPGAKRVHDGASPQGGDDPELAAALAASLDEADGPRSGAGSRQAWRGGGFWGGGAAHDDEDADLAAAIAASLADHSAPSSQQQQQQQQQQAAQPAASAGVAGGDDEDPLLAAAIAASLQPSAAAQEQQQEEPQPAAPAVDLPALEPEPEAGSEGAIELGVKLPSGPRVSRRFLAARDTLGHVSAFAAEQGADMASCQLVVTFPRRVFEDWGQTLAEAGVGHKELIVVEGK